MKLLCLVTAYERPEMLSECLRHIRLADGEIPVRVLIDSKTHQGPHPDIIAVTMDYRVPFTLREVHGFYGNSLNTLLGYKEAYEEDVDYCFLIEDDVMVTKDFFRWHLAVHQQENLFTSVGAQCTRRVAPKGTSSDYFTTASDYASLGVCMPRYSLGLLAEHAKTEYFQFQGAYVREMFPTSRFINEGGEQDGLVIRIMGEVNGLCAYPCVPRAFHLGVYGYHRLGGEPQGTLEEKIHWFQQMLRDAPSLERFNSLKDLHPYQEPEAWDSVRCVARF